MRRKRGKKAPFLGSGTTEYLTESIETAKSILSEVVPNPEKEDQAAKEEAEKEAKAFAEKMVDPKSRVESGDDTLSIAEAWKANAYVPKGVAEWASFFEDHREFLLSSSKTAPMIPLDMVLPCHYTATPYVTKVRKGTSVEEVAAQKVGKEVEEVFNLLKNAPPEIAKALPPSFQTYATLSYQPDQYYSGTLVWPGIPPSSLTKIVQDNIAPNMIIGLRVADITAYSNISQQPWMPGWNLYPRFGESDSSVRKKIKEAEYFLQSGTVRPVTQSERRMNRLMPIRQFLAAIVRDSLTYDGIAIWTHRDKRGRVIDFAPVSAEHIRLVNTEIGYLGDKNIFAVGVDEIGNPVNTFTADELYWYVRNPRLNVEVHGYGNSEVQIGIDLINGFSNALTMNSTRFTSSSIPNGIMLIKNGFNQRVLDAIQRQIINFTRGPSRRWTVPVIGSTDDIDIQMINLTDYSGVETLYPDYMNMLMGALSVVYRIPVTRMGYRPSGKISEPKDKDSQSGARSSSLIHEADVGKVALLDDLEWVINDALIWPTFPELTFRFLGKNPVEDARQYQERVSTMTYGERRTLLGLPRLVSDIPSLPEGTDEEFRKAVEKILYLMDLAPGDKSLTGVFQSILSGQGLAGNKGASGTIGANSERRDDPAESEARGYISGVPAPSRPAQDKKPKDEGTEGL